jgi:hypothetical protein
VFTIRSRLPDRSEIRPKRRLPTGGAVFVKLPAERPNDQRRPLLPPLRDAKPRRVGDPLPRIADPVAAKALGPGRGLLFDATLRP